MKCIATIATFTAMTFAGATAIHAQQINPFVPSQGSFNDYSPGGTPGLVQDYDLENRHISPLEIVSDNLRGVHTPGEPCAWGYKLVRDRRSGSLIMECLPPPEPQIYFPPEQEEEQELVCDIGFTVVYGRCEYIAGDEDVLLVHGFNVNGGFGYLKTLVPTGSAAWHILNQASSWPAPGPTDCEDYWFMQKMRIETAVIPSKTVKSVGLYSDSKNCDVMLPDSWNNSVFTGVEILAEELYEYIKSEYTQDGKAVDIVAHSMGGIVVRKMLENYGDELMVDQIVTLGTPHNGHSYSAAQFGCPQIVANLLGIDIFSTQCSQMSENSTFMNSLEHNPQSKIPTQWSLIGTWWDETVGIGTRTGTAMNEGDDSSAPSVKTYTYQKSARWGNGSLVRHGTLHGLDATIYNYYIGDFDIASPTQRILNAID